VSLIAWLDTSADEQRRIREIVNTFSDKGTLDELGIGQIRDAFSDALFPGTSTIQTRARYLLFVPWLFQRAADNAPPTQVAAYAERYERQLVEGLRAAGDLRGLIGRQAGVGVKRLPSSVYWGALQRFGILTRAVEREQVGRKNISLSEADELVDRTVGDWNPTLPPRPKGLPHDVPGGFDLTFDEASWLRERIVTAAPGTHLAHLVTRSELPEPESWAPWDDASAEDTSEECRRLLSDAELFSTAVYGASLLYNLLIAERYEAAGYTQVESPIQVYRDRLDQWCDEIAARQQEFQQWNRPRLWAFARSMAPTISLPTMEFVNSWLDALSDGTAARPAGDPALRSLVAAREQRNKGPLSRLTNTKMLASWSGHSGDGALVYRWPQVRTLVTDIQQGLRRAAA
jgi:hypothetical protein